MFEISESGDAGVGDAVAAAERADTAEAAQTVESAGTADTAGSAGEAAGEPEKNDAPETSGNETASAKTATPAKGGDSGVDSGVDAYPDAVTPVADPDGGITEDTIEGEGETGGEEEGPEEEAPEAEAPEAEGPEAAAEDDGASPFPLASVVEAILFAARDPLKPVQIARAVGRRTRQNQVRDAVAELNVHYLETGRAFEIAEISGRFQLMSRPEYAEQIMRIYPKKELGEKEKRERLTPAALDTLAIIAYKQPVMRSEIEHIRGVACGPMLKTLIERGTVREVGRRTDLVGKPAVFGTTERFLVEFGLGSLEELPLRNEFASFAGFNMENSAGKALEITPAPAMKTPAKAEEKPGEHSEEKTGEKAQESGGEKFVEAAGVALNPAETEVAAEIAVASEEPPEDNGADG